MEIQLTKPLLAQQNKIGLLSVDLAEIERTGMQRVPYNSVLSFEPLLDFWRSQLTNKKNPGLRLMAEKITEYIDQFPLFQGPITDEKILDAHPELVSLMMSGLFPAGLQNTQLGKAGRPFHMQPFFMTEALREMLHKQEACYTLGRDPQVIYKMNVIGACSLILNQLYDQNITIDPGISLTIHNKAIGVERHFKSHLITEYVRVVPLGPVPKLTQADINALLKNIYDEKAWLQALPPELFEFQGIMGISLTDVTREESVSQMRFNLLKKDAFLHEENIEKLKNLIQVYFGDENLHLGITAIDYPMERRIEHQYRIRYHLLAEDKMELLDENCPNNIYQRVCKYNTIMVLEDLAKTTNPTKTEKQLLARGIRSMMIAPLHNQKGDIIGIMEVGSNQKHRLNSLTEINFKDILPLFSMAMERSRDEVDNHIEAIIREQFTNIHPSVEWRFIKAAYNLMEARENNRSAEIEPVVFEDVHPIYGQADIVNSSNLRNEAIRLDFIDNLERIRRVLRVAMQHFDFPILGQYLLETDELLTDLNENINSAEEAYIVTFIRKNIHPLLKGLTNRHENIELAVHEYFKGLDDTFGIVYNHRKDYEDSVFTINETLSSYLQQENTRTQEMISHYFEKYQTDGVEYELYLGDSLIQGRKFEDIHLHNMRLWQLESMCEMTHMVEELKKITPVTLSTAQLIFVYGQTLSIRFRMDEKQFDVDGTYNVRYEIIKKRIDKALVKGTEERLTQSNKIAIVYNTEEVYEEYMGYLKYLQKRRFITEEIEELDIEALQGVNGLKALRVTVNLEFFKKREK